MRGGQEGLAAALVPGFQSFISGHQGQKKGREGTKQQREGQKGYPGGKTNHHLHARDTQGAKQIITCMHIRSAAIRLALSQLLCARQIPR